MHPFVKALIIAIVFWDIAIKASTNKSKPFLKGVLIDPRIKFLTSDIK